MEPKLNLRGEQKEERRRRILEAAREIIADRGFESLTMRVLAAQSRVTVPTIYNLVGSKEAVLAAAIEEQTTGFVSRIASAPRATPASAILSVIESSCNELVRLPDYYQSLLRLLLNSGPAMDVRNGMSAALVTSFERALVEMKEAGELADWVEIQALASRLAGHLRMTSLDWAAGGLHSHALLATSLLGTCLMMLGVATGESRVEIEACAKKIQRAATPRSRSHRAASPAAS